MLGVLLSLGAYRFSVSTAAYQSLARTAEWRWPAQDRLGAHPLRQYVGPGNMTVTLDGVILPHYKGLLGLPNLLARAPAVAETLGRISQAQSALQRLGLNVPLLGGRDGRWQLETMRRDAGSGRPLLLVDGRGRMWGYWVIERLSESESALMSDGAALRVDFSIDLAYYGETADAPISAETGLVGALRGVLGI